MLHDVLSRGGRGNYHIVREDQIRYALIKPKKGKPKINIKFGREAAKKAGLFAGEILLVQWDDANRHVIITKSEAGFRVIHPKNQKMFILLTYPEGIDMPETSKTFTNFVVTKDRIVLDFSFIGQRKTG